MSVSREIINVLDAVTEKFGIVVDWSAENVIPYFEQLCSKFVTYEIATSILWIVLGIILCIAGSLVFRWTWKHKDFGVTYFRDGTDDDFLRCMVYVAICVSIFLGIVMIIYNAHSIITACTFPEKLILEEIKSIYESMK